MAENHIFLEIRSKIKAVQDDVVVTRNIGQRKVAPGMPGNVETSQALLIGYARFR